MTNKPSGGACYGAFEAVELKHGGSVANNGKGALIQGYSGVNISGTAGTITNSGTIAATGTAGQAVNVTYIVDNLSDIAVSGDWFDSLYLTQGTTLDANAVLLTQEDEPLVATSFALLALAR